MKRVTLAVLAVVVAVAVNASAAEKTAAELEKEKAMSQPYPNDFGPDKLSDAELAGLSKDQRAGYDLLIKRCAQCHNAARPLNSRFVEPKDEAELAAWKKSNPEMFKDAKVWQIEVKIWNRYVKRMMAKPGCKIEPAEGKKIWEFLVADGKRKVGANAAKWAEHRKKLLGELKAKNAKRYEELEKAKDL